MNTVLIVFAIAIWAALHHEGKTEVPALPSSPSQTSQSPPGWRVDWASARLNYFGRVEPLLQSVAQAVGLKFIQTGPARPRDVYVWVDAKGRPLEDVLAEIARQLNHEADIVIRDREIELRWR